MILKRSSFIHSIVLTLHCVPDTVLPLWSSEWTHYPFLVEFRRAFGNTLWSFAFLSAFTGRYKRTNANRIFSPCKSLAGLCPCSLRFGHFVLWVYKLSPPPMSLRLPHILVNLLQAQWPWWRWRLWPGCSFCPYRGTCSSTTPSSTWCSCAWWRLLSIKPRELQILLLLGFPTKVSSSFWAWWQLVLKL